MTARQLLNEEQRQDLLKFNRLINIKRYKPNFEFPEHYKDYQIKLIETVCKVLDRSVAEVLSKRRNLEYFNCRQMIVYVLVKHYQYKQGQACVVVNRERTNVYYILRTFEDRLKYEPDFAELYNKVINELALNSFTSLKYKPNIIHE